LPRRTIQRRSAAASSIARPLDDVVDPTLHDEHRRVADAALQSSGDLIGALAADAVVVKRELPVALLGPVLVLALLALAIAITQRRVRIPAGVARGDRVPEDGDDHARLLTHQARSSIEVGLAGLANAASAPAVPIDPRCCAA
jgi:hypothetical protein